MIMINQNNHNHNNSINNNNNNLFCLWSEGQSLRCFYIGHLNVNRPLHLSWEPSRKHCKVLTLDPNLCLLISYLGFFSQL